MPVHLDEPAPGAVIDPASFGVRGWLWLADRQSDLAAVEVWANEVLLGETKSLGARPDVNAALQLPPAIDTGFAAGPFGPLDTTLPQRTLAIRVRFRDGTRSPVLASAAVSLRIRPTEPFAALLDYAPDDACGLVLGPAPQACGKLQPFRVVDASGSAASTPAPNTVFAASDALPVADASLDYVANFAPLVLDAAVPARLREWHRVLYPDGLLFLEGPARTAAGEPGMVAELRRRGIVDGKRALFTIVTHSAAAGGHAPAHDRALLRKIARGATSVFPTTYTLAHVHRAVAPLGLVCPVTLDPLRCTRAADGTPTLVAEGSGRVYSFRAGCPVLTVASDLRPRRPWAPTAPV